jgi:hypothetical protein
MASKQAAAASAASPFPQVEIGTSLAPGKRGPVGLAPRTDYSRPNTVPAPSPDAGASEQKSMAPRGAEMLPKLAASEGFMGQAQVAVRPTINEMVKQAMAGAVKAVDISREATRQAANLGEKTASAAPPPAASTVSDVEHAEKLASALDYVASLVKQGASLGGPYSLREAKAEVGHGPGALHVLESQVPGKDPIKPNEQGHGHSAQVSKSPALDKSTPAGPATQMETNMGHAEGMHVHGQPTAMVNQKHGSAEKCPKCDKEMSKCSCAKTAGVVNIAAIRGAWAKTAGAKTASDEHEKKETEGLNEAKHGIHKAESAHKSEPENKEAAATAFLGLADAMRGAVKTAEDAINPAHISAGAAVPPDTREAGQPGGVQAKGSGPGMVSSNTGAIHYNKGQAKAEPKTDSNVYWKEPALSSSTDKTLGMAFKHTGEAGTKFASAEGDPGVKTAAARALLTKLAAAADEKKAAEQAAATGS